MNGIITLPALPVTDNRKKPLFEFEFKGYNFEITSKENEIILVARNNNQSFETPLPLPAPYDYSNVESEMDSSVTNIDYIDFRSLNFKIAERTPQKIVLDVLIRELEEVSYWDSLDDSWRTRKDEENRKRMTLYYKGSEMMCNIEEIR